MAVNQKATQRLGIFLYGKPVIICFCVQWILPDQHAVLISIFGSFCRNLQQRMVDHIFAKRNGRSQQDISGMGRRPAVMRTFAVRQSIDADPFLFSPESFIMRNDAVGFQIVPPIILRIVGRIVCIHININCFVNLAGSYQISSLDCQ